MDFDYPSSASDSPEIDIEHFAVLSDIVTRGVELPYILHSIADDLHLFGYNINDSKGTSTSKEEDQIPDSGHVVHIANDRSVVLIHQFIRPNVELKH